jgi:hypothetical protein
VNILHLQAQEGEKLLSEDELARRYAGFFNSLKELDQVEAEP